MDTKTFDAFRKLVYQKAGICINDNKSALVAARVSKRMRELQYTSDKAYLDYVLTDESGEEIIHLLDVISTNVTSFFRESTHFDFLKKIVGEWSASGQKKYRIWCAAASSGEEPYTIAMTMLDALGSTSNRPDLKILATDISTRVLAQCKKSEYSEAKLETVPTHFKNLYFHKKQNENKNVWAIKPEVKEYLTFTRLNLSTPPFPMSGPFDAVFCRNVMIYFDNDVRKKLLEDVFRLVKQGGYLFVGHAESLTGILSGFKAVVPSIYIKS